MSINVYLYQLDKDEPKTKKFQFSPEAENPQETKSLPQKARNHFCNECDASFTCPVDLKRHIDSVHLGKKPFKCNIVDTASLTVCDYACARKWDLKRHRMGFHENAFICFDCFYSFSDNSNLERHVCKFSVNKKERNECNFCEKSYAYKTNLTKHMKKEHQ